VSACHFDSVKLTKSRSKREEELYVDLICDRKAVAVMIPLHRKPEFQRYIESVLRQHVGETVDQIREVEIEGPKEE
jgi:hypothetical protein